jgi:hypothetical protein
MARSLLVENLEMAYITAPAIQNAPTAAEITAALAGTGGIDLVGVPNGEALVPESVQGFSTTPSQVETPDYVALEVGKISGPLSVDDAVLEFYWDDTTNAIYTLMTEGVSTGCVTVGRNGAAVKDAWPVTIQSKDVKFTGNNEAQKWVLNLACGVPNKQYTPA